MTDPLLVQCVESKQMQSVYPQTFTNSGSNDFSSVSNVWSQTNDQPQPGEDENIYYYVTIGKSKTRTIRQMDSAAFLPWRTLFLGLFGFDLMVRAHLDVIFVARGDSSPSLLH